MSEPLQALSEEVATELEGARIAHDGLHRVRQRLRHDEPSRFRRPPRLRLARIGGAAAALAAAAAAVFLVRASAPKPELALHVGAAPGAAGDFVSAPAGAEVPLVFSDGTRIDLAPNGRMRVSELAPTGAHLVLESGEAHVDVVHRDTTRWRIDAGPFVVHVTGTVFDVRWDAASESLAVDMRNGSVVVTGCDLGEKRVSTGEHLHASCKQPSVLAAAPLSASAEPVRAPGPALPPSASEPSPAAAAIAPPAAIAAAAPPGTVTASASVNADQLLERGERARRAGDTDGAAAAFSMLRARFPGTDAAAAAAFELGRIDADRRGDPTAAAVMFEACFHERPQGNLAREAMGRAIEARANGGDPARAYALATEYQKLHPNGPHAALAARVVARGPR